MENMMPANFNVASTLAPHIVKLIDENRENLINSAVQDEKTRAKLIAINKAILDLKYFDPDIVGAWGLGCGAGCLTGIDDRSIDVSKR
jgi:hypothetical protein